MVFVWVGVGYCVGDCWWCCYVGDVVVYLCFVDEYVCVVLL